jgi:hypothetical protein
MAAADRELTALRSDPVVSERPDAAVRLVRKAPPAAPVLVALGRERGEVRLAGHTMCLSARHTELLVVLAGRPHGMTSEELALALYGESGRPATARTALCRLRKDLGAWIHSERNLVRLEVEADFLVVGALLRAGRIREAAQRYSAALLPRSEAPGVVDARDELDAWVRSAVMTSGDREALWAWLESASGCDDAPAWKRFLADVEFADPRRPFAASRLARLRNALTIVL